MGVEGRKHKVGVKELWECWNGYGRVGVCEDEVLEEE